MGKHAPSSAFFGRRKGRPLRAEQKTHREALFPLLALDLTVPAPLCLSALFPHDPAEIFLEIGFGGGEHLLARALETPRYGFIGVEPFVNGMAKALVAIARHGVDNIRLSDADAKDVLDWLPEHSLAGISLLYPDPWPKRRHWKRRFVNPQNLDRLARALQPGGIFRFASDSADYVDWTLHHGRRHPAFLWTAIHAADWERPFPGWPGTRYEEKARRAGRMSTYLTFTRV